MFMTSPAQGRTEESTEQGQDRRFKMRTFPEAVFFGKQTILVVVR